MYIRLDLNPFIFTTFYLLFTLNAAKMNWMDRFYWHCIVCEHDNTHIIKVKLLQKPNKLFRYSSGLT